MFFSPAGHLSYRQMESVREVLRRVGTWDLVRLHCGEQLKGDYRGCQYIALNRQETDTLEFSRVKTLSADSLWALLGHTPQVSPLRCALMSCQDQRYILETRVKWTRRPAGGSSTLWLSHSVCSRSLQGLGTGKKTQVWFRLKTAEHDSNSTVIWKQLWLFLMKLSG